MESTACLSIVKFLLHYSSTEDEEFVLFSVLSLTLQKNYQSVRVVQGHKKLKLNLKSYSIFGNSGAHHQRAQGCGN